MKAAIYNPYLDTLGGGERYSFAVAEVLAKNGYMVDFEWSGGAVDKKVKERFGIDTSEYKFVKSVNRGDGYDVCFWVSDGSIPLLRARNNIIHFQIPFQGVGGKSLINKTKFFRVKHVICNSNFTKNFIDREYGVISKVVYPPVDVVKFKSKRKEDIVVYVGRFSVLKQAKGQEVLIDAFRKFSKSQKSWQLVLAGGADVGAGDFVDRLKESGRDLNLEILEGVDYKELQRIVGKSKIFWSAAGYGVEESKNPEAVEHFGISLVEAMAAKCVPVVFNAGGYKEIVKNGESGFLWNATSELVEITKKLSMDAKLLREFGKKAGIESEHYSYEKFSLEFEKYI